MTKNRRLVISTASAVIMALVVALFSGGRAHGQTEKRNIVFIFIDDQRYDAMGFLGGGFFETPHMDALAAGGVYFEKAFVTTSLCSPSRASVLTGQYAHRHGVLGNSTRLNPATPTFPREMQKLGYETAFVGKWHMGGSSDAPRPGFDRWVSFRGQGTYRDPNFNIDGENDKAMGYTTDLITDHAIDFLERPHDKPFFLYLSHKAVHSDFSPAERHAGTFADKTYAEPPSQADTDENYEGKPLWLRAQRHSWHGIEGYWKQRDGTEFADIARRYGEALRAVDDSVGRVVATLRERGLLDSTLIVFTSDNGFQFGEHGLVDKRTMYEASIRVPLLVHCPELFEGGRTRQEMILNIDFAPTLIEAAGGRPPETMQGRSFYKLLSGETEEWRDEFLYEYYWERSFPQTPTVLGVRTDRYKFMKYHGVWDRYELYDLQEDPDEMNNLLGDYLLETQAGNIDQWMRRQYSFVASRVPDELRELYLDMDARLGRLLEETGSEAEPNWTPFEDH